MQIICKIICVGLALLLFLLGGVSVLIAIKNFLTTSHPSFGFLVGSIFGHMLLPAVFLGGGGLLWRFADRFDA